MRKLIFILQIILTIIYTSCAIFMNIKYSGVNASDGIQTIFIAMSIVWIVILIVSSIAATAFESNDTERYISNIVYRDLGDKIHELIKGND